MWGGGIVRVPGKSEPPWVMSGATDETISVCGMTIEPLPRRVRRILMSPMRFQIVFGPSAECGRASWLAVKQSMRQQSRAWPGFMACGQTINAPIESNAAGLHGLRSNNQSANRVEHNLLGPSTFFMYISLCKFSKVGYLDCVF